MHRTWKMQPSPIATRWAESVNPANAWPEYPRPQMVRSSWQNLNGLWQHAITAKGGPAPDRYEGHILVPYPLESALSGVKRSLKPDQLLWYRRAFSVERSQAGARVLLHFGAVDYEATVYINGQSLGTHAGGYQGFTFDISAALKTGENELIVKVHDPSHQGPNPFGKQSLDPIWMRYTASSGIWQTVWLEQVPSTYIGSLKLIPDVDRSVLHFEVVLQGEQQGYTLEAIVRSDSKVVAHQTLNGPAMLRIEQPRLWSPDDPYLYDLEIRLLKDSELIDTVKSYFGMRKIEVKKDSEGIPRIYLNNRYTYNLGVVDQGFWPDGLYTAPTDAALKFDLQAIKALGFNTVRKHLKVEPQRWYTYCDQVGLMVWQDMPSANNDTPEGRAQFERELEANLAQLHNHPSIVSWVLFNEGWGAYDQARLALRIKQADPSRLLNGHSAPYDLLEHAQYLKRLAPSRLPGPLGGKREGVMEEMQDMQYTAKWVAGDLADFHYYPGPKMPPLQREAASVIGEYGSFGVFIEGHVWDELKPVGVGAGTSGMTPTQMLEAYASSIEQLKVLEEQGLTGSQYFEIFDVEGEHQGFITYDREIAKVPVAAIAQLNARLVPQAMNYDSATAGFSVNDADLTPEGQRYARLVAQYREGKRELSFLKRLALMASRQADQEQATEVGHALIAQLPQPYSKESWAVIVALTRTSNDAGFELLRTHAEDANEALGLEAAQKKLLEIIGREAIEPYFKDKERVPDWAALEESVISRYALGREAIYGARMMYHLAKGEWVKFGEYYARYFESAIARSFYPLHSVSYQVLKHVSDAKALETAVRAMRWSLDAYKEFPAFGRYDPTELDTYANLLYKAGRKAEALEWQEKAVVSSDGRDREIIEQFENMKTGVPTWGPEAR